MACRVLRPASLARPSTAACTLTAAAASRSLNPTNATSMESAPGSEPNVNANVYTASAKSIHLSNTSSQHFFVNVLTVFIKFLFMIIDNIENPSFCITTDFICSIKFSSVIYLNQSED